MEWVNARAGAGNRKVKWKEEQEKWNERVVDTGWDRAKSRMVSPIRDSLPVRLSVLPWFCSLLLSLH